MPVLRFVRIFGILVSMTAIAVAQSNQADNYRLDPNSLKYQGAFRLPDQAGGSSWEYSGSAMTYFPEGDPQGSHDPFPGSLFIIGHDHQHFVSEVSIPIPLRSASKNCQELNTAETLQPFNDIRSNLFPELEIPRAGLAYLPAVTPGATGKLHYCFGQHFQFEQASSHGWVELTLAKPRTSGPWRLGDFTNYVTNDYLCPIPEDWSRANLPGYQLATGRFRDGQWGGLGPSLLAYKPPQPPGPEMGTKLQEVVPLLMYGTQVPGQAELEIDPQHRMKNFSEADEWSGVAWVGGKRPAVLFTGTKALGKTWYGFANGVVYPIGAEENEKIPDVPPFPYDSRGWWSTNIAAQLLFFDPHDLAAVAKGTKQTWEPQPYATLDLTPYLYAPGFAHERYKRYLLGDCCVDNKHGIFYLIERQADGDKSLVHVFQIDEFSTLSAD